MAQNKHLHELLREDQEPFHLRDYISHRKTQIQLGKRKPISDPPPASSSSFSFPRSFCKSACFFSFRDSPDVTRSPLSSKIPNRIFLHVPSRTAAVLLDAAARIQRPPKPRDAKPGLGMLGSVLKKLAHRNRSKELEIAGVRVSAKDKRFSDKEFSCSCDGRLSSAVWSESNEERSLDLETSSSSSGDSMEFGPFERLDGVFDSSEKGFRESPFRFVLQRSPPSPGVWSPPPCRRKEEEKLDYEEKEEGDKEQCSPVSVLEPHFNDDFAHEEAFDLECSFAAVQRTKQQLLDKLHRFEKLADLDPIELEKRMEDPEEDEDDEALDQDESCGVDSVWQIPVGMKRLVSDLIAEESEELHGSSGGESVSKRVRKRLECWEEVEPNTMDMMVEMDFRREVDEWKRNQDQVGHVAMEIERAIFKSLVEELSEETA